MNETIKILTIQDISCYGQCSITVALPVVSAFGIETAILPSAVLSTHTSGFTDFTVRDLTEDLPEIRKHWEKEGILFDAIYTGFIASIEQLDYIKEIIDSRLKPDGLVFVDPAMADHGEFYNGFDQEFADKMGELCKLGDYVLPNTTEACYILHKEWKEEFSKEANAYVNFVLECGVLDDIKKYILENGKHQRIYNLKPVEENLLSTFIFSAHREITRNKSKSILKKVLGMSLPKTLLDMELTVLSDLK